MDGEPSTGEGGATAYSVTVSFRLAARLALSTPERHAGDAA
jgi:hypothetical protein